MKKNPSAASRTTDAARKSLYDFGIVHQTPFVLCENCAVKFGARYVGGVSQKRDCRECENKETKNQRTKKLRLN